MASWIEWRFKLSVESSLAILGTMFAKLHRQLEFSHFIAMQFIVVLTILLRSRSCEV